MASGLVRSRRYRSTSGCSGVCASEKTAFGILVGSTFEFSKVLVVEDLQLVNEVHSSLGSYLINGRRFWPEVKRGMSEDIGRWDDIGMDQKDGGFSFLLA